MSYAAERKRLINWLKKQLIGPARPGELQGISPLRRYPVGVLYPIVESGEGLDPASEDDDFSEEDYTGAVEMDSDKTASGIVRRRYIPPSSVGYSFYVDGNSWSVQVIFSAAIYSEIREDNGQFSGRYKRTVLGGDEHALLINSPGRHFVFPDQNEGEEIKRAGLDVQARQHGSGTIVTVSIFNNQEMAADLDFRKWSVEQLKRSLFEVELACFIESGAVGRYPKVEFNLLDAEEQELELQYKSRTIYAIGHGCAVEWREDEKGVREIRSEFMPVVEVPQVTADVAGGDEVLNLAYLAGSENNSGEVCASLRRFVMRYENWIKGQDEDLNNLQADERKAGERIVERMKIAFERMEHGISLIERDAKVASAFALANQAMLNQMQQSTRNKGQSADAREYNWRPFQLAFILTALKSSIDQDDDFRDTVDLIWFPTGGGKTEAYLGLIAIVMLWRRFKFPHSGGGTTSFMRYTLRLLTTQQYLRASRIVCALELIRRSSNGELGNEPFSIGLWVGAASSPNTFDKAKELVESAAHGSQKAVSALVIDRCPWCEHEFHAPTNYQVGSTKFHFVCTSSNCAFGTEGKGVLPCNVVDEALYKEPPTLLIATIDKFARLAWDERAGCFFGVGSNRPPELVVQDELHLVAGALGSVAGVYEAGLETVLVQRGIHPKYIASTATIRMAENQVRKLYGKDVSVFPPQGIDCDDSFFSKTVPISIRAGRLYVGYFAPMLSRDKNLAPLAAGLLVAPEELFAEGAQEQEGLLEAWWSQVIYHGSLKGVGNSHNAFNMGVREWYDRLKQESKQEAKESGEPAPELNRDQPCVVQLTSVSSAEENARTFARLERPRTDLECIDVVLATNMVSVGLDVGRLALMVINGQPLTTAEYIQASSRVGRSEVPGIVFANYYRDQARSLSHYENFRPYHESFYRFVEPTSITPFTHQARMRALHAGLVIAVRHVVQPLRANDAAGKFDPDDTVVARVIEAYTRRCIQADPERKEEIRAHIRSLASEWSNHAKSCAQQRRQLSYQAHADDRSVERLLFNHDDKIRGVWPTLQSMRNVEDTGLLKAI
ncbi:helicase-related protein [Halomonas tibetensis]|uniref:Helicase-related protein n=1 Tax=Halomonas tibetensis TaxID=2259590 RepID=A0ABV7BB02_9GAMM